MLKRIIATLRLSIIFIGIALVLLPLRFIVEYLCPFKSLSKLFVDSWDFGSGNIQSVDHNAFNLINILGLLFRKIKYCLYNEIMIDEKYPNHTVYTIDQDNDNKYSEVSFNSVIDPDVYTVILFGTMS